ncbi:hypothetical protein FRC14_005547 [Serendipita sp. 396]|nr:hypothetical protein FRC14_005547 [Serendipita sp. 396]KAG8878452.1 hypothetical protein FRC20_008375 [Serendipita sp. 405]
MHINLPYFNIGQLISKSPPPPGGPPQDVQFGQIFVRYHVPKRKPTRLDNSMLEVRNLFENIVDMTTVLCIDLDCNHIEFCLTGLCSSAHERTFACLDEDDPSPW